MISRLTAFAACFAVLSAAMITFAANTNAHRNTPARAESTAAMPVVQLERVEIVGHRSATTAH